MAMDQTSGGSVLREGRKGAGLTLEQAAARMGCSKPYLSMVESGRKAPSADWVARYGVAIGVNLEVVPMEVNPGSDQVNPIAMVEVNPVEVNPAPCPGCQERDRTIAQLRGQLAARGHRAEPPTVPPAPTAEPTGWAVFNCTASGEVRLGTVTARSASEAGREARFAHPNARCLKVRPA